MNVQIEDSGNVTFTKNKHGIDDVDIEVYACIFDMKTGGFKDFDIVCEFPKNAKQDVNSRYDKKIDNLNYNLEIEKN